MKRRTFIQATTSIAYASHPLATFAAEAPIKAIPSPLRPHPENGRWFADHTGRALFLAGSHLGWELQDFAWNKSVEFDYAAYLDLLTRHGHNLIRLWNVMHTRSELAPPKNNAQTALATPMPYLRSGKGKAMDGESKFDLTKINPEYFKRMRTRVQLANDRGLYVMPMLFQGWSCRQSPDSDPWFGHVLNPANNINDTQTTAITAHRIGDDASMAAQLVYTRAAVKALKGMANVIWEISNESQGSIQWHEAIAAEIRKHDPMQRPIVISGCKRGLTNDEILASSAQGAGLSGVGDRVYLNSPPASDGSRVIIHDSDHIKPDTNEPSFVWRNLMRGNNAIVLDWGLAEPSHKHYKKNWESIRAAMGQAVKLSKRIDLAKLTPQSELSSTKFCLSDGKTKWLVFAQMDEAVKIDLRNTTGRVLIHSFDAITGKPGPDTTTQGGAWRQATPIKGRRTVFVASTRF